ncbi:MAG: protein-L-isoaspartate(D-aspartate) O-methyltransferase [Planctomycetota bacterium]|jgi:protein-L-isoaspartate(D-aspartate) O-methyltransferase
MIRFRIPALLLPLLLSACPSDGGGPAATGVADPSDRSFRPLRLRMVRETIVARGVEDSAVLEAMRTVRRHLFVPKDLRDQAYIDDPLPIGHDQTISQPYIVAVMTEAIRPKADHRVLEIGTGSGYQAAVLARIVRHVYSIEIVESLARSAERRLAKLGYENVTVRAGDGYVGWAEHAPFDSIIVTAAPDHVPEPLVEQLAVGGRMVIPVGRQYRTQDLLLIEKTPEGAVKRSLFPVRFVPMTGRARNR